MRSRIRYLSLLIVPVIGASVTLAGRHLWCSFGAAPVLSCPESIDLGEQERGAIAVARVRVFNSGRSTLLLQRFATSCSCAGVEQYVDGRLERANQAIIGPGEHAELIVRIGVSAPAGEQQTVLLHFASNDPNRPAGVVRFVIPSVVSGIYALPVAAVFGEVRVSSQQSRVIELYDNRQHGSQIVGVRSLRPERFTVHLLPPDEISPPRVREYGGQLLSRLEVKARTLAPGPIDGDIEVRLAGRRPRVEHIHVFGEVVDDIECRPSKLVILSQAGLRPMFANQLRFRHRDGKPFRVTVEAMPPNVTATINQLGDVADHWLVTLDMTHALPLGSKESSIRLRLHCGESEWPFVVPILCLDDGE